MFLQPNDQWQWHYDAKSDRLMLELSDDMVFATEYQGRQLVPASFATQAFCVEDASLYYQLMDHAADLNWSIPQQVQLVLNAIAVHRFYKPLMPQSWFFIELGQLMAPQQGELVIMHTQDGQGTFMVIEAGEQASVCLNLTGELMLSGNKLMPRFAVIKVMNNRFGHYHQAAPALRQVS
ncbi:cell division protein ZapC [Aeromonas rivuli]|uniref:cell division protein ZapC n=1 Tax=Aeromonas rivuli TaxID=648794 RepID=UPI0005A72C2E|nr:cell division protein ZapC [Aeromonas rivuli]